MMAAQQLYTYDGARTAAWCIRRGATDETMKQRHSIPRTANLILIVLTTLLLWSCKDNPSGPQDNRELIVQGNAIAAGTIVQVDDYPLFVMNFSGDYGFADFLKTGSTSASLAPHQEQFAAESPSWGCTCFSAMGNADKEIFGRNFDWYHHVSLVLFTHPPSAFASLSTVDISYLGFSEQTTLEQIRNSSNLRTIPYLPFDGVNEKGVAIGIMAIPHAEPPYDPRKVNLTSLEIIRLVLDYASSTESGVSLISQYNYVVDEVPIHFLIGDSTGKSALVEFIGGEMKVMYNDEPFQVSTNFIIFGSSAPQTTDCWRYNRAYAYLKNVGGQVDETAAMSLLSSVSQNITMWSAVYDMSSFAVNVSPGRKYDKVYGIKVQ
jgi:penicillin V acylase-like amidase (Ntn superfamily)